MSESELVDHKGVFCPRCKKYEARIYGRSVFLSVEHKSCDFWIEFEGYVRHYLNAFIKNKYSLIKDPGFYDRDLLICASVSKNTTHALTEVQKRTNNYFTKFSAFVENPPLQCPFCQESSFVPKDTYTAQCKNGHIIFYKEPYLIKILNSNHYFVKRIKGTSTFRIFSFRHLLPIVFVAEIAIGYAQSGPEPLIIHRFTESDSEYHALESVLKKHSLSALYSISEKE